MFPRSANVSNYDDKIPKTSSKVGKNNLNIVEKYKIVEK